MVSPSTAAVAYIIISLTTHSSVYMFCWGFTKTGTSTHQRCDNFCVWYRPCILQTLSVSVNQTYFANALLMSHRSGAVAQILLMNASASTASLQYKSSVCGTWRMCDSTGRETSYSDTLFQWASIRLAVDCVSDTSSSIYQHTDS